MRELVTYEHLRELQHFAKLGRMSASLLHEISNPLTAALLNLELSDKRSSGVRQARRDIQLLRRYVEAARQQVRLQSQTTSFRVQPQLDQLKRIVMPLARKAGVRLDIKQAPDCRLYGDPVKFQHVISNLVVNAIQACSDSGKRAPLVRLALYCDRDCLVVRVIDNGEGMAPEALSHIFDAFYTTKGQSGRGLGIGLAIVKQYVTVDFGGSIKVNSSRGRGTKFVVRLPNKEN